MRKLLGALLFWLALASSAQAGFIQIADSGNTHWSGVGFQTTVATFGAPIGSGDYVVMNLTWDTSIPFTNITSDKGDTLVAGKAQDITGDGQSHQVYYLWNVTSAPTAFTVNCAGVGCKFIVTQIAEYSGLFTSGDPNDVSNAQFQNAPGAGADAVSSATTGTSNTNARDLVIGAYVEDTGVDATTFTAGTGYTKRGVVLDAGGHVIIGLEDKTVSSIAALKATMTVPTGTGHYSTIMQAFKLAPAGGPSGALMGVGQ